MKRNKMVNFLHFYKVQGATDMKKKKQQRKAKAQKQRSFVQRWSPHEQKKQYTALQDPHANYYFCNKSVNKHLKQLKKVINQQKNQKEKAKIKEQISEKLSSIKLPNLKISPKTVIYAHQLTNSMNKLPEHYRKKSEHTIVSHYVDKSKLQGKDKNQANFSVAEIKRYRKTHREDNNNNHADQKEVKTEAMKSHSYKMNENEFALSQNKQVFNDIQKYHRESHAKFLDFLVQRKRKIQIGETSQPKANVGEA